MSLAQTKAAALMQESADELTSHQVISLLMDGAIERADQAAGQLQSGNTADADVLVAKLVGIIIGLRGCLNLEAGGEIAVNLEALYTYMVARLAQEQGGDAAALEEVQRLISEIKAGWDAMDDSMAKASSTAA